MTTFLKKYALQNDVHIRSQWADNKPLSKISSLDHLIYSPYSICNPGVSDIQDVLFADIITKKIAADGSKVWHIVFGLYDGMHTIQKESFGSLASLHQSIYRSYTKTASHLQRLWVSLDQSMYNNSLHIPFQMFSQEILLRLAQEDFLKRKKAVVYWSEKHQTALNQTDIQYVPRAKMVHGIRYFIDMKKESFVIPTHRPETLFGDVALAVHPLDRRFKKMVGKKVIVPIINKIIPIVADEAVEIADPIGLYRVTPAHDKKSFEIAQRHGLPLDIYAYDKQGLFTEHAGIFANKPVQGFTDNIVQYLRDIHNLESSKQDMVPVPFCARTQEYVQPLLTDQWVVQFDTVVQKISDYTQQHQLPDDLSLAMLAYTQTHTDIVISHELIWDTPIYSYFDGKKSSIYDGTIALQAFSKNKYAVITAIVVDLIHRGLLQKSFGIDQLFDVLFGFTTQYTLLLEEYISYYSLYAWSHIQSCVDALLDIADTYKKIKSFARCVDDFVLILQKAPGLEIQWDTISLSASDVFDVKKVRLEKWHYLVPQIVHIFWLLYYIYDGSFDGIIHIPYWDKHALDTQGIYILLGICHLLNLSVSFVFSPIHSSPHTWLYHKLYLPLYKDTPTDVIRHSIVYNTDALSFSSTYQKIWNTCRYVWLHKQDNFKKTSRKTIDSFMQKNYPFFTDFDQWIAQRFMDTLVKVSSSTQSYDALLKVFVDDFSVKYIELIKKHTTEHSWMIAYWCVAQYMRAIFPLHPYLSETIIALFGYSLEEIAYQHLLTIQQTQKNYKIHLLMNIVWSLKHMKDTMGLKNHTPVDVIVRASLDMTSFVKQYEDLIQQIIHTTTIVYTSNEHVDMSSYLTENVVDMTIWLKQSAQQRTNYQQLQILLHEKREYLSHLRALMSMAPSPDKEEKIAYLKSDIDKIEAQMKSA